MGVGRTNSCVAGGKLQIGDITQDTKYATDPNFLPCEGQIVSDQVITNQKLRDKLLYAIPLDKLVVSNISGYNIRILSNGIFTGVTDSGKYYSVDGINFKGIDTSSNVVYFNGAYFCLSSYINSIGYFLLRSTDLSTWIQTNIQPSPVYDNNNNHIRDIRITSINIFQDKMVVYYYGFSGTNSSQPAYFLFSYSYDGLNWNVSNYINDKAVYKFWTPKSCFTYKKETSYLTQKVFFYNAERSLLATDGITFKDVILNPHTSVILELYEEDSKFKCLPYIYNQDLSLFKEVNKNEISSYNSFNSPVFSNTSKNILSICYSFDNLYDSHINQYDNSFELIAKTIFDYPVDITERSVRIYSIIKRDNVVFTFLNIFEYAHQSINYVLVNEHVKLPYIKNGYIKIKGE